MATRTNVQANQASVTSIKPTITPSSPSTQSNLTLPSEFPAHLLLRICDAILEPLLSYNSPLKPHTKPWGRTTTASTWFGSRDKFGSASSESKPCGYIHNHSHTSLMTDWNDHYRCFAIKICDHSLVQRRSHYRVQERPLGMELL